MSGAKSHILIIDDDERLRQLIIRFLNDEGFRVTGAGSSEEARQRMQGVAFDILVVDIMMPGESGLELVRDLKQTNPDLPCLMLTAMGEPGHRLHGLETGADDYMTKPFEPLELSFRVKNILSRVKKQKDISEIKENTSNIRFGPHLFDLQRMQLTTGGHRQHLTTAEKDLLSCFCRKPRQTLSREDLSDMMGGQMEGRSIDVAIARLRRKIEPNPSKAVYLLTVRGQGWTLEPDLDY